MPYAPPHSGPRLVVLPYALPHSGPHDRISEQYLVMVLVLVLVPILMSISSWLAKIRPRIGVHEPESRNSLDPGLAPDPGPGPGSCPDLDLHLDIDLL